MSEVKNAIEQQTSSLLTTTLTAPALPPSLILMKGDIAKYLKGENETLLFARTSDQDITEASSVTHQDTPIDEDYGDEGDREYAAMLAQMSEITKLTRDADDSEKYDRKKDKELDPGKLNYILLIQDNEDPKAAQVSSKSNLLMCFLFDVKLDVKAAKKNPSSSGFISVYSDFARPGLNAH